MVVDTCMAVWNLVHQGKYGRMLDMLLSVFLIGFGLFLLLNIVLPDLTSWTMEQFREHNPPAPAYASAPTPHVQLSQAPVTPTPTRVPTRTVARSYPCVYARATASAEAQDEADLQPPASAPTPLPPSQESSVAPDVNIPDIVPTVSSAAAEALASAEDAASQDQDGTPFADPSESSNHTPLPGLGSLPVKMPTPFGLPWHDKSSKPANTSKPTPASAHARLSPTAVPQRKPPAPIARARDTGSCLGNDITTVRNGQTLSRLRPVLATLLPWIVFSTLLFYVVVYAMMRRRQFL